MIRINKKAQGNIGVTISLAVATAVIALIILFFALASTLFKADKDIAKQADGFSLGEQAKVSLFSLMNYRTENLTVSDRIRVSKTNSSQKENTSILLENSLNKIYSKWWMSLISDSIIFSRGTIEPQGRYALSLPDSKQNIAAELGVSK